jgi:hypothetical protein
LELFVFPPPPLELFMFIPGRLELFMLPPLIFPLLVLPPLMLLEFVFIGVAVLIGVGVAVFMVLELFIVEFELFAFSLPQPMPKAATASKVRRAKVLRIELSPVTQTGQLVRELKPVNCLSHMKSALPFDRSGDRERVDARGKLIIYNR